ncbi:phage Gp19/Gp15/Gp42 family protein [Streptomyces sp. HU2014]|uniref:phage Gp19/Gp15/Gp42 family protein n=1 Tax=Streptomyces sp. HU2014 TaxID=2939414 RepID=UPI00201050B0|nr:phage Gp19/Gp15/Gp42 family protein [Streptomyces sp. HU2014]UQI46723.1 phage Gp19/Gp15/Gp42 family protein [Streptomyces sp. HU2014]
MSPLADIAALEARLGWALVGQERAQAEAALADASALVRAYGHPWPDPARAPDVAVSITLAAAERRVRNPEGYRSEMQGSYQYQLPASLPSGVALTDAEIRLLRSLTGASGLYSVPISGLGGPL